MITSRYRKKKNGAEFKTRATTGSPSKNTEIDMNNNKIVALADPKNNNDAVNLSYLNNKYLDKTTGGSILGGVNMNSNNLFGIQNPPTFNSSAVSKAYIDNKTSFFRVWSYSGLTNSFKFPCHPTSGWVTCFMLNNPSSNSKISIVGIHCDNDSGGLNTSTDGLEFQLQYITSDGGVHTQTIFQADLQNYTRYSINDGQGLTHNFSFLYSYNLNSLPNYQNIKVCNIGIRQYKGNIKGNETTVVCGFDNHD